MDPVDEDGHNKVILVVEDAENVRKMVCAMLGQAGYLCLEACDGEEALGLFERAPASIDLVLTDVVMPRMSGPELARRIASVRPDLRVMFMSGYSEDPIVSTIERSPSMFLAKPFTAAALMGKVRETLTHRWLGLPQANLGVGGQ